MSISQSERRKRPAIHPLARPKTRSFRTFRNLSFDRSTTEDKPLYLTSFTGKRSSPKPRQRTLSAPSQRLENSISRFDRRPTCAAATTGCYGPPLCIRPIRRSFSAPDTVVETVPAAVLRILFIENALSPRSSSKTLSSSKVDLSKAEFSDPDLFCV